MITVGIAVVAGLCYWFDWHQLAFWILVYAIVYGGLDAARGTIKASAVSKRPWGPGQNRPWQDR
jgi:hypothetical protein